jgi:rfaE bifunctional protein kinase chain/domain
MKQQLKKILNRFTDKRIIVWGDLILDEYIYTTAGRISREAPVLVTEFESNEFKPGGAGNVVMNIGTLGAVPVPVGFIGKNSDGDVLKEILKKHSITTDFLIELEDYRTPKKSRILSGGENTKKQQVLRIDVLNRLEIKKKSYQLIEAALSHLLEEIDFLVISDYIHKSVSLDVLKGIREKWPSRTIIADSRNHLPRFKNISVATPNEPEIKRIFPARSFYDDDDYYQAGLELLERLKAQGIVLKRGHKGMIVFEKDKEPVTIDIHGSADIVDVTGAGDTVISVLGLSLCAGADLVSSARLATIAAGLVVMKEGCYPLSKQELEHELE